MGPDTKSPAVESRRLGFLDLPEEIQKDVFSHCSQADWICLSLVSHHFRELAAAQLYRSFHIVFPDEDDSSFDSPIDGLAGGLDTFVTSDYNYAKHLRDISLDTLSTGPKAELAYKSYLFNVSCGKFMNTLLLLTLRKAKSLDTFRWNIRVELSRPVYKALHNIKSLRHLHLRLQAGPSLYEPPPPVSSAVPGVGWPVATQGNEPPLSQAYSPPPLHIAPQAQMSTPLTIPSSLTLAATQMPELCSGRNYKKSSTARDPPTLSGFKQLESLSILDIDSLDIITEIKSCVRNSSSTLKSLKLSFSDVLAMQARKPSLDAEVEDSDQEDDFQVVAVPPAPQYNDGSGPAKIFRAQEERKAQETVLGRIFEVEPFLVNEHQPAWEDTSKRENEQASPNPGEAFIDAIENASRRMWANLDGSSEFDIVSQQEALDQIIKAAKLYVESKEAKASDGTSVEETAAAPESTDPATLQPKQAAKPLEVLKESHTTGNTLLGLRPKDEYAEANPEDIDVTAPEEEMGGEGQDESNMESPPTDPVPVETPDNAYEVSSPVDSGAKNRVVQLRNVRRLDLKLELLEKYADEITKEIQLLDAAGEQYGYRMGQARLHLLRINALMRRVQNAMNAVEAETDDIEAQAKAALDDNEELRRRVTEYGRDTRGIALESLAIYHIPTKASVLGRAIDLRTLKRITLLNVGPQAPIWALLIKENKLRPLPLRMISTDNVCPFFLQLVSRLDRVDELFMLERGSRFKPESFAPKTRVDLGQIKKMVLKKHMETLKILMIKNEADGSWDVDEKTIQLICRRGRALEELAVVMGIRAMHMFLQHLAGLKSLHALHILSLRSDDTCVSVLREMRRFVVDMLSHHPELKLEWIAVGDEGRAQQIIRRDDAVSTTKKNNTGEKDKGKWKPPPVDANGHLSNSGGGGGYPVFPAHGWEPDSETDDGNDPTMLRLDLSEPLPLYDIWGVHIFQKEIVAGRL
ncbi:hypothetical protein DL766_001062 [Monosporascus sp. MC13-8B]|uniref:F-box domain-containing protein n=1 Tax=Monosporascus cannonballus TaxID=155416 RepID=A0ABY0H981_9PEZI|nr:hypothetical protein DL762_005426 [Monosporascus cannonballus]RYO98638.1 hypothetical protein DL763_002067 [Monosporascus cannonballus]RYP38267.1 hypothetical protein DL766_001062 [Monosporascus sp. MC13-8B]